MGRGELGQSRCAQIRVSRGVKMTLRVSAEPVRSGQVAGATVAICIANASDPASLCLAGDPGTRLPELDFVS